jgi:alpha-L-fucosidase
MRIASSRPRLAQRTNTLAVLLLTAIALIVPGAAADSWDELAAQWTCPAWFQDAKFGLWLHWGPQSVPEYGGGWYARHMYMEPQELGDEQWGRNAWEYHRKNYGHQSDFGYKEICREWKAEKFDADATMRQFRGWGARYVAIMGNHHDNFDLFDSSVHLWNTTRVGPKRDIVREFAAAARRYKLPWMVSVHASRAPKFFEPAGGSDSQGAKKGVLYDGVLTREGGKGKWWDGLDPQQLYATHYPAFEREFLQRLKDLVRNYRPDMIYFDDARIPRGTDPAALLYAQSRARDGSIQAIVTVKTPQPGTMRDVEKGGAADLESEPWQTDTTLASDWFLKHDDGDRVLRHDLRSLVEALVDTTSKNGSLLLNVAVRGDGSVPDDQRGVLDALGEWLQCHGQAIYGTRPWKIYGSGGAIQGGHFHERLRDSQPWGADVIRFTRDKANRRLFVFVFGAAEPREVTIDALAGKAGLFGGRVRKVSVVGDKGRVKWTQEEQGLRMALPGIKQAPHCAVLAVDTNGL